MVVQSQRPRLLAKAIGKALYSVKDYTSPYPEDFEQLAKKVLQRSDAYLANDTKAAIDQPNLLSDTISE